MNTLPLRRTVAQSYGFAVRHFPLLVRVGWPWFLLAYGGTLLAPQLAVRAGLPELGYLADGLMMIAGTAVLVAWHRSIAGHEDARTALFGRREALYLGLGIAMLVALYLPVVAMMAITHFSDQPPKLAVSLLSAGFLAVAVSINRLILVFPAIALGLRPFSLRRSWTLTAGNTWRLFMGVIACSAPPLVVAAGLTAAAEIMRGRGAAWWIAGPLDLLSAVGLFVQLAVVGGFLSFVFAHFVGARAPRARSAIRGEPADTGDRRPAAKVA